MISFLVTIDRIMRKFLTAFCCVALFLMVAFTVYTVFMRYVFLNPPVWGDLMTVLSNIWLVFIALSLTVREKEHIALNLLHERLPLAWAFGFQILWSAIICVLGVVIAVYGYETAMTNFGKYWEMWYITWQDGGFVFKPNYMPKTYPLMILPLAGTLIAFGALIAIIEDIAKYRAGTFELAGGTGSG